MRANHHDSSRPWPPLAISTPIALLTGEILAATPAIAQAATPAAATSTSASSHWVFACGSKFSHGKFRLHGGKNAATHPSAQTVGPDAIPSGVGYGPAQLQAAYALTAASAANGAGRTVAVVDAYDYPNAASDLAAYRSAAGLPAANFTKVNQNGATSPLPAAAPASDDWTIEAALDLDMASAICPLCNLVLVEAQDDSGNGLYVAQNAAASLAGYISNSWGGGESSSETSLDNTYFTHASGIVTTVSAGDSDYGVSYPATSPKVVSVGGTRLSTASNARGWTESVWNTTTRLGGHRLGLLGLRGPAVLAVLPRAARGLLAAHRQRRGRRRRPGHRRRRLRHVQR